MTLLACLCTVVLQNLTPLDHGPALPVPVSNNAVVAATTPEGPALFSFMGIDSTRRWDGITNRAFRWLLSEDRWTEITPVPGPGRIAPTVQAVADRIYLFGGYTVAADGSEKSVPNVDVFDPTTGRWSRAADMPVPVDDAVSGTWRDSLIYLVSGWHDTDNVSDVQVFDPAANAWQRATPIPGTPVFGHSGAIAGDAIVYVNGAHRNQGRPRYVLTDEAWMGRIDPADPTHIRWSRIEHHPGPPLYRAAAVGVGNWVIVAGGTDNAYNYNGIGYDGVPSTPRDAILGFNVVRGAWSLLGRLPAPSMDHRTLGVTGEHLFLVGGMGDAQQVTGRTVAISARAVNP